MLKPREICERAGLDYEGRGYAPLGKFKVRQFLGEAQLRSLLKQVKDEISALQEQTKNRHPNEITHLDGLLNKPDLLREMAEAKVIASGPLVLVDLQEKIEDRLALEPKNRKFSYPDILKCIDKSCTEYLAEIFEAQNEELAREKVPDWDAMKRDFGDKLRLNVSIRLQFAFDKMNPELEPSATYMGQGVA